MLVKAITRRFCVAVCVGAVALVGLGTSEAATQLTRLANDEPEIRVRADGRAGVCDVLAFTPDGGGLVAVGEDKVIHRWGVGDATLRPTRQPIFWNTFREQRGSIYAMAISTTDPLHALVAIGGNGKLNPDVAVFDLKTGQLLGAVSPLGANPGEYAAAEQAIWALAFHRKNTELAIGDELGNVWVCPLAGGKPVTAQSKRVITGKPDAAFELRVVWVGYTADDRLAYAKRDGGVYVVGQAAPLFRWKMGAVDKVVASADGRVLAARPAQDSKAGTQVEIRSLVGGVGQSIAFKEGHFPNRIALDKTGSRLAAGVSLYGESGAKKSFAYEPPGEVIVYDVQAAPKAIASRVVAARPDQIAFHPDGKRLATADSLDHTTTLWIIDGTQLRALDRDTNNGQQLWAVGMTADSRYLCFKDKRDPDPPHPNNRADPKDTWTAFDLSGERGWAHAAKSPVPPENTRDGWKLRPDKVDDYKWFVVEPNGREHKLPLDELHDDRPRCYTFLPGTKAGSVRLAVGHAWGVSVFDLVAGQAPVRVRRLNGHAGYVTSIAPAYGGKGLVTCGRDQAIAIWSLADFPSEPLLGAAFASENGKVVVKTVDRGSPADEAGLTAGDEITAFTRGDSSKPVPRAKWLAEFRDPQPMREMLWGIERAGLPADADKRTKTALLHRPVAKFIPFANGEWLLYTYRQSYYDCSANGDHYIEWLVSKDRADKKPDVFPVDQFSKFLHRPDKVARVITQLEHEPAKPLLPDLFPPTVTVKSDVAQVVAGQDVTVTVTVVPSGRQDGKVNPVAKVELWLNRHHRVGLDTLVGKRFEVGVPFTVTFKVPVTSFRSGPNELQARGLGFDDPGTGCGSGISAPLRLTLETKSHERRLFVLVAGIGKYEDFGADLPGARRDALRMADRWDQVRKTGGYAVDKVSEPRVLIDQDVTKTRILGEMKEIAKLARPNDTFVLCLAGHGANFTSSMEMAKEGQAADWYYLIPRVDNVVLVPTDIRDPTKLRQAFVKDAELASLLISMNCQPIVLLDCCHSGGAVSKTLAIRNTSGRGLTQNGFGPVVISSCAVNQLAWEHLELFGGGIFSYHVLQAVGPKFTDADKNNDGKLSVMEFFQFVESGTLRGAGRLTDPVTGKPPTQQPKIIPPAEDLKDLIIVNQTDAKPK